MLGGNMIENMTIIEIMKEIIQSHVRFVSVSQELTCLKNG